MTSQLQQVLQALEPCLRRQRPLLRACPQLLLDLAALLSGLRAAVMLDHAPGATPGQLQHALKPLAELLPQFQVCILVLDGCCYIANTPMLQQRIAGLAGSSSCWPVIVSFSQGQPAVVQPEQCQQLQQQLQALSAAVQQQLQVTHGVRRGSSASSNGTGKVSSEQQLQVWPCSNGGSGAGVQVFDLGQIPGLPAMPTLNGFLLGYPVVYWVQGINEAAAASKQLSVSLLRLYRLRATCSAVRVTAGCSSSSGVLLAFTVPEALCDAAVESKVQQLVEQVTAAAAAAAAGGGGAGTACWQEGEWRGFSLSADIAESGSVSL